VESAAMADKAVVLINLKFMVKQSVGGR
jgi:hypothetical protein